MPNILTIDIYFDFLIIPSCIHRANKTARRRPRGRICMKYVEEADDAANSFQSSVMPPCGVLEEDKVRI